MLLCAESSLLPHVPHILNKRVSSIFIVLCPADDTGGHADYVGDQMNYVGGLEHCVQTYKSTLKADFSILA